MVVFTDHPEALLSRFVAGTLPLAESDAVLAHLDQCEQCLEKVEHLWATTPLHQAMPLMGEDEVDVEPERGQRIERRVINQIHRSEVAGRALWLGTEGFLQVSFALLRPLLEKLSR